MDGSSCQIWQPPKNESHLRENETLASACCDPLIPGNSIVRAIRVFLELLSGFKCPGAIVFGELPKQSTGKIQKFRLREQEWTVQYEVCHVN